jgi:lysophospholipase L1-like esterase
MLPAVKPLSFACLLTGVCMAWACSDSVETNPATTAVTGSGAGGGGGQGGGGQGGDAPPLPSECFADHFWPFTPQYDQFNPVMGSHCVGTNHQAIEGIEKLVFLGDSITQGTPPTGMADFYRTVLGEAMTQDFPGLEVVECANNGDQIADLLNTQIPMCFPGPEPKKTLVVLTIGGNDYRAWAENNYTQEQALADADALAAALQTSIEWFREDPARFPAGVEVVFGGVYEFTDGTGELGSCPGAQFIGLPPMYTEGAPALAHLAEQYVRIAVETQTDFVFMLESFCGHGYKRDDSNSSCYLGTDAELWFDISCIHPNPTGHHALAGLFQQVIEE